MTASEFLEVHMDRLKDRKNIDGCISRGLMQALTDELDEVPFASSNSDTIFTSDLLVLDINGWLIATRHDPPAPGWEV